MIAIRKEARAAAALFASLGLPATPALADTPPGTQSGGNFELLVRVEPPEAPAVTILGLDDIPLGTFQRVGGQTLQISGSGFDDFCIIAGWSGSVATYPGPVTLAIYQVGGGVNGRYALKGRSNPSKNLPISFYVYGAALGGETRPGGGTIGNDGSSVQIAPSFNACSPANTNEFNSARIGVAPDAIPADSDMADGELSAIFSILVYAPS